MSRALRRLLLLLAVTTAAVAVFGSIGAALQRLEAASSARAARDYGGIAYAAGRQRRLLIAPGALERKELIRRDAQSAARIDELLDDLSSRVSGREGAAVAALKRSYDAAARASARALRQTGAPRAKGASRAAASLATVSAGATRSLRERQSSVLVPPPSAPAAIAVEVAPALTAVGALILLCVVPWRRRRASHASLDGDHVRLEMTARTDSLTGVGNHRGFHHDLAAEVQRCASAGSYFALMAIDLDGLKQVNDTQGHQAGDRYIALLCDVLRRTTEGAGTVYRVGGDEFMVLLPNKRNWDSLGLAHKIDEATRAAVKRRALSIGLTESLGPVARHELIHQADVALYEAKRTKLTAVTYHPGLMSVGQMVVGGGPSHHQKTLAASLARAVDAKDVGTRSHSETVAELCVAIGQRLGIEGDGLERLRIAGLLHDVGKIGVPDVILHKPTALASSEQDEMRAHVSIGHGILIAAELTDEAEWVLHHHERVDGDGYPNGLREDLIPIQSRIIAAADAFEAMTGSRAYRASVSTAAALDELATHSGSQFDGRCVHALVEVVDEEAASRAATALTIPNARRDLAPAPLAGLGTALRPALTPPRSRSAS